jgi:2-polyprenyl-3-methyl-5-hydroxy-6-metoxy-1,4-benzoquinol methylase
MDQRLRKHDLGYWEIDQKPTTEELQKYYAEKYFQEGRGSYELQYTPDEIRYFRAKIEQRLANLQLNHGLLGGKPGRMLDVGCGEGYALAYFRERGWSVRGFDFSAAGVASKNPGCSDALVTGDVFALLHAEIAKGETYDVVWLQNVLEHVIDPIDVLKSLRALVRPHGFAVVCVPNDCSITQRAALAHGHIDRNFWVAPPDHLNYFDYASLGSISNATGWRCAEILGDFPVDWYLFHPGSNYVRDKTVGKAAHHARIQLENMIHEQPIEDVLRLWSAVAKAGLGRDITAFLQPVPS